MKNKTETTTSSSTGNYPNNVNAWVDSYFPKKEYEELISEEEVSKEAVYETIKFYSLSKYAKKFMTSTDATSTRNVFHAAEGLKVPLSNTVSTFYTSSLSALEICEFILAEGNVISIISQGPEWWFLVIEYKGVHFVIFNCIYGNPLADPTSTEVEFCITIKVTDFEMLGLLFPEFKFELNPELELKSED